MPDPIKKQIADKLIALLEAWNPFYVAVLLSKAGNVGDQAASGWLRARLQGISDFPRIGITNGRFTSSGWTVAGTTYAGENAAATEPHGVLILQRRLEFRLTITARDLKSTSIDPAEEEAQNALLQGGRHLGLSFVSRWGPITADQYPIDGPGRRVLPPQGVRLESQLTIPVFTEQDGSEVLT